MKKRVVRAVKNKQLRQAVQCSVPANPGSGKVHAQRFSTHANASDQMSHAAMASASRGATHV